MKHSIQQMLQGLAYLKGFFLRFIAIFLFIPVIVTIIIIDALIFMFEGKQFRLIGTIPLLIERKMQQV